MNKKILIILILLVFVSLTLFIYFKYFQNKENIEKNDNKVEIIETVDKTIPEFDVTQSPTMFKVISWGDSNNSVVVNKSWPVESNKDFELQLDCKQDDLYYVNSFNQSKVQIDIEVAKQLIGDKNIEGKLLSGVCSDEECTKIVSNCILTAYEK